MSLKWIAQKLWRESLRKQLMLCKSNCRQQSCGKIIWNSCLWGNCWNVKLRTEISPAISDLKLLNQICISKLLKQNCGSRISIPKYFPCWNSNLRHSLKFLLFDFVSKHNWQEIIFQSNVTLGIYGTATLWFIILIRIPQDCATKVKL